MSMTNKFVVALALLSVSAIGDPVKIMPVGDSITRGGAAGPWGDGYGDAGWRYYIENLLTAGEVNYDMVGDLGTDGDGAGNGGAIAGNWSGAKVTRPLRHRRHSGHTGWSVGSIRDNISAWLTSYDPAILLLMIGTNDIGTTNTPPAIAAWSSAYNQLLANVVATKPACRVVMAAIPPRATSSSSNFGAYDANVRAFNAQVVYALYTNYVARGYDFRFADNYACITTNTDFPGHANASDYVHPNGYAHQKFALNYFHALSSLLTNNIAALNAEAEAFVRGGASASQNFGTTAGSATPAWRNSILRAKADATAANRTKSYLRFNVGTQTNPCADARLSVVFHGSSPWGDTNFVTSQAFNLYGVLDGQDAWLQTNITWNNAPGNDTAGNGVCPRPRHCRQRRIVQPDRLPRQRHRHARHTNRRSAHVAQHRPARFHQYQSRRRQPDHAGHHGHGQLQH
ncbi:MAG: GDSL-type esterase/lipase family protein [bacterium]|nr:GDSL-type esterase/lipase family protein [bacterium]